MEKEIFKSKKFIETNYLGISEELLENELLAGIANNAVSTAAMAAVPLAASAVISIGSILKNAYDKYRYDKKGCDNIIDPNDRSKCEARNIDRLIAQLRTQMKHCDNTKDAADCRRKITMDINKNIQRKQSILTNYEAQDEDQY